MVQPMFQRGAFLRIVLFACAILIGASSCDDGDPVKPPPAVVDTTSHNFVWYTDTLAIWPSRVNDVFCLSENDAWAVGLFYLTDSTGRIDENLTCYAAHWDGVKWTLMRVKVKFQDFPVFWEPWTVYAFSKDDLWCDQGHWNGREWKGYDLNSIARGASKRFGE